MIPLRYNIRSLMVRKATTAAATLGIALVVFVLASALMLSEGVKETLSSAGREDIAIVLRKGSDAEMGSTIEDPQIGLIKSMSGVKRESDQPLGTGEVVIVIALEKLGAEGVTNVLVRGVTETSHKLRPDVKIVEGRLPSPGSDEVMIGRAIRGRIKGVELNQSFDLKKNRPVKVVGVFEDNGSSYESEVWADLDNVRASFGRQGAVSSVRVVLDSPASFDAFQAGVESDKRLGLMAKRETKYFEEQSQGTSIFLTFLGGLIAFFFSIGAMIGATITMYASIANRQREIGTLRALGFSRFSILICFLFEAVLLSLIGGLLGLVPAIFMGSIELSMVNFASWSELVFRFRPTPEVLGIAVGSAVVMGILGGFLPAVRAARTSPLAAMRA
ncbi:MAG: ABC transporter permease [Polyangiaceae bacterium]|nr:ABC transporter permease [Polyangiaceae bacterium]